jgi:hypothetical protein
MEKNLLACWYVIESFDQHEKLKDETLKLIERSPFEHVVNPLVDTDITRTDWNNAADFQRDWVGYLKKDLLSKMLDIYSCLGYSGYRINEIWYQQYQKTAQHGWHTHTSNLTNVYYLELPENCSKTQIVVPYDQDKIIELDVKEGDIVCFPSFVIHRATPNLSNSRKTIISFNTDLHYPDENYGKGLEKHAIF